MTSTSTLNRLLSDYPLAEYVVMPGDTGVLYCVRHFLKVQEADEFFQALQTQTPWQTEHLSLYGKTWTSPRLTAWYGDSGARYAYSGVIHEPLPWTDKLGQLRQRVESACGQGFNSVLLNLYRDGRDSVGWHSDDEVELGRDPLIASLSLGQSRRFLLKPRGRRVAAVRALELEHGSLLCMAGSLQHHWKHSVPKERGVTDARINLTFRSIREQ